MEQIRNFVIISHVDHGKSTLADRFLELTKTVDSKKMQPQYLDMMDLEREKGITIKMQPVRMCWNVRMLECCSQISTTPTSEQGERFNKRSDQTFILNLIDTPGHVDFSYEVSRSLAAVEGAILLVDATQGIQAQTIGNLELARKQNLTIIPVINKIDLPHAEIEETKKEIANLLKIETSEILKISAKEGVGIKEVLEAVVKKIPSPEGGELFRALVFDSKYDPYKGVIAFVRVFDGEIKKGEPLYLIQSKIKGEAKEVGVFKPELTPIENLRMGEIGYIATGIKELGRVRVGDTITSTSGVQALPGYQESKPMVFLSVYPENPDDFESLKESLEKLRLNDAALNYKPELKEGLGRGFQCGFLGLLHVEITTERLKREFGLNLVLSTPSVVYKIKEHLIRTPGDWPEFGETKEAQELWAKLQVLVPPNHLGPVLELLKSIESQSVKIDYLGAAKVELIYEVPLREIITKNLYDKLKSVSQGFASMNYEILDWREAQLVKLDILILGKKEEIFSKIVSEKDAHKEGKKIVEKLKEVLPPQLFAVPLQAAIGSKIIARETIKARRRDVIAPLYGGDYTRKRKLLERQKKGKRELKEKALSGGRWGGLKIPSRVFLEIFKS